MAVSPKQKWAETRDNELDYLGTLKDDWNGRGANAICPACLSQAREIIKAMPQFDIWATPMTFSRVKLEWWIRGVRFETIITPIET